MALAKKCDRCGKFYRDYIVGDKAGEYNGVILCRISSEGCVVNQKRATDLCENCMKVLMRYLRKGERE